MSEQWSADDLMIVNAARQLCDDSVCFVGIGLPSTAANLARRTHATKCTLIYESGCIGSKPTRLPLSIGDGDLADTADSVVSVPEIFAYWLQAGRGRRRLPRRGAARPLRQHQLDGHRRLRAPDDAPARRRRRSRDRRIRGRGHRHRAAGGAHLRRALRLPYVGRVRRRGGRPGAAGAARARAADRHHRPRHPAARPRDG